MLELLTITAFFLALVTCLLTGRSILVALLVGYVLFAGYAFIRGFKAKSVVKMSISGLRRVKGILATMVLIGMLTAIWRDCGTIAWVIYNSAGFIIPSCFYLAVFLICCLVSVLTGTAFGTAATVGIISMAAAHVMGADLFLTGGAILSGIYFGDRCSPMSTSAHLVCALTDTNIYDNINLMIRSSLIPLVLACFLYFFFGLYADNIVSETDIWSIFSDNFNLSPLTALPALLIFILCVLKVGIKKAMFVSIITGSAISIFVQHTNLNELLSILVIGFKSTDEHLAPLMNGGGIISMYYVIAIVSLSSTFDGIFEGTSLLKNLEYDITLLSRKIGPYATTLITAALTNMLTCNQVLATMLTSFLCRKITINHRQLALDLENTVIVIAGLVPWSVAAMFVVVATGAPISSVGAAFYLYVLPLWQLVRPIKA